MAGSNSDGSETDRWGSQWDGASEAVRYSLTRHYESCKICVDGAAQDDRTDGLKSAVDSPRCGTPRTTSGDGSPSVASGGVGSDQSGCASFSRRARGSTKQTRGCTSRNGQRASGGSSHDHYATP